MGDATEPSRARWPDETGFVERGAVRVSYEVYGSQDTTVFLLPMWAPIPSRFWKAQIPYLARRFRVIASDPRGSGRSDRPAEPGAYATSEFKDDFLAVMDATGTSRATIVSVGPGAAAAMLLAAEHPERVDGALLITPDAWPLERYVESMSKGSLDAYEDWDRFNPAYWQRDWECFAGWWMSKFHSRPHSTRQIEDGVRWMLQSGPEVFTAAVIAMGGWTRDSALDLAARVRCPVLIVYDESSQVVPADTWTPLAAATGGRLLRIDGANNAGPARYPVPFNLAIRDFVEERSAATVDRTAHRPPVGPRALFVSSPIGLGHAQRDVAIARELRGLVDGLEIDWLAQDPVTRLLEGEGERIHPGSGHLANESRHLESESAEHDLHCFHAWRRMDEIMINNFMVFHDVAREERYDLWIGDEAWELDHYLHENPGEKRARYAWLTDFVGWLPMPDGGEREACLTADYNAEMVGHVAAHPNLRDRAIFVGNPADIVDERLGPQLPMIRDWTERNFEFSGYVTGFDPATLGDRAELRDRLGYGEDEKVCIVSVGGTGVGGHLLRRVIASFATAKRRVPELRMIAVAGPRIDPDALPRPEGLEVVAYVHNLYRHLAACDLAVVQGGLTTAMELTASGRPFLYFPLRHHFEQNMHVAHRLDRYGAGRRMDFETADPDRIAEAIAEEIGRPVAYREVETDGARRAAEKLAELL